MNATPVRYRITPDDPYGHVFEVTCTVAKPSVTGQRFTMPAWIPGSYLIREFARQVVAIHAHDAHGTLAVHKESKDTWRVDGARGALTVTIRVYAFDLSVRTAFLDGMRGFFNGPSVFLRPEGHDRVPCEVEIARPAGAAFAHWRVATAMPRLDADASGFGRYGAESYPDLIDHPVEMSDFTLASFEAGGALHQVAITGRHDTDVARLASDLARICAWQCRLFEPESGVAPFDRYVFLVAAVGEGYGGLEHRASTSLICRRDELPYRGMRGVGDDYRTFLGLASHEYFHSWNVKRITPAAFTPYDLARENYTRDLWAYEGITSYYDDLALVRSGVLPVDDYLELVGRTATTVLRTPGRHVQSIAESSFDAWIKFYRPDENTPNAVVSYYAKGALVALALDLTLRAHGTSLDDVMRALWQRYGTTEQGVPEGAIASVAEELAQVALGDFFARHVHGTDDPPLAELLRACGVTWHVRPAAGAKDRGGGAGKDLPEAWLGAKLGGGQEPRVQNVFRDSPAERAGLAAGDTLVAIDGLRASAESVDKLLHRRAPGEAITLHAFRRDELVTLPCTLAAPPADTVWLDLDPSADEATLRRRAAWLGEQATAAKA